MSPIPMTDTRAVGLLPDLGVAVERTIPLVPSEGPPSLIQQTILNIWTFFDHVFSQTLSPQDYLTIKVVILASVSVYFGIAIYRTLDRWLYEITRGLLSLIRQAALSLGYQLVSGLHAASALTERFTSNTLAPYLRSRRFFFFRKRDPSSLRPNPDLSRSERKAP